MSIFDALPDPGLRIEAQMTKELELRRSRADRGAWQDHAYLGGADFVLRHGRFWRGRMLPEQYRQHKGPFSACFGNALAAAQADPSLRYVEGYHTSGFGHAILHGWCMDPDGGILELTLPVIEEEWVRAYAAPTGMRFLPPDRWAYYGVAFETDLVVAHNERLGLPMLEYGAAELADRDKLGFESNVHDFPVLKLPFDPNRKDLP